MTEMRIGKMSLYRDTHVTCTNCTFKGTILTTQKRITPTAYARYDDFVIKISGDCPRCSTNISYHRRI